jgi:predicted GIY-YIG superfamily endonuclease
MTLRNEVTKGQSGDTGMTMWFTYILECADDSYYVGITNNLDLRLAEHNSGQGARWTAQRRPVKLRYAESHFGKGAARKREIEIKGWRREKKVGLFDSSCNVAVGRGTSYG